MRKLSALFVASACLACAATPYRNPLIGNPARVTEAVADPQVLKFNGEYYLYATGNPIVAWHSKDLVSWDRIGPVFHGGGPEAWNAADVWAPECVYRSGKFYLYYSATRRSDDWRTGEMARRVGVAVADSPRGPFIDSGTPLTATWGIDGHLFRDPDTGAEYMFYSFLDEPEGAGIVADRVLSPVRLAGRPSRILRGSEAWEDKDGDSSNGSIRYTNEAPTVLKRGGLYYVMYSGGSWDLPSYSLAYAVSPKPPQGDLDAPAWRKIVPPVLRSSRSVEAPGHNAIVKAPNNVDDICFYHARVVPFAGPGDRIAFADRLFWEHGRMRMDPPTLADLRAPERPAFRDLFDRAQGPLGGAWRTKGGAWSVNAGEASEVEAEGLARAFPGTGPLTNYIFEANLRLTGGGRAGAVAYSGSEDELRVWLDPGRRTASFEHASRTIASAPLPADFRAPDWHQLIVVKNGPAYRVALDGVWVLSARVPQLGGKTLPGLLSIGRATFDGVALASWFEDSFDTPEHDWIASGGLWLAESGALRQAAGGGSLFRAVKGDPASRYEFTASVRWGDQDSNSSLAGVVAATDEDGAVIAGFSRDIWPLARFTVERVAGGAASQSRSVILPRGFQYEAWHTIRTVREGGRFTFYLDGQLMLAASFDIGPARVGLFTRGVRASFDDCELKRLEDDGNLILDGSLESAAWDDAGQPLEGSPWKISGSIRGEYCCAFTGNRRLVLRGGEGRAVQEIAGLAPGSYVLDAFVQAEGGASGAVAVVTPTGRRQSAARGPWNRVSIEFEVVKPGAPVLVEFGGVAKDGLAAADDFYLYRRSAAEAPSLR